MTEKEWSQRCSGAGFEDGERGPLVKKYRWILKAREGWEIHSLLAPPDRS